MIDSDTIPYHTELVESDGDIVVVGYATQWAEEIAHEDAELIIACDWKHCHRPVDRQVTDHKSLNSK